MKFGYELTKLFLGFGDQDVENDLHLHKDSVLRIASISKSLTMAAVALLVEQGKLDLDAPVQKYVPDFPKKQFEGKDVSINFYHGFSAYSFFS